MSSFKKLSKADITTVPYAANKQWSFAYTSSIPNDGYMVFSIGKKEDFNTTGSTTTNGLYQSSIYDSINHLFYQKYTDLLDTGSIMFDVNTYQSASQQRPTGSYFNYNINPLQVKNYPTGAGEQIGVLSINQSIFGSKILPYSFRMSSSLFNITDDGYGNLYSGSAHIGNIFYAHGIAIITNQTIANPFPQGTGSCSLYSLAGVKGPITEFYYVTCSGTPVTESISDTTETRCILNSAGITVASGPGGYTLLSPTCGDPIFNISSSVVVSFQNEHIIYENEVRCIVKESEFNLSYNPTLVTGSYASGSLRGFATSASFEPYATTIGMYNDENELLMVAKLGKPIMISPDTDMTFIVRYDT